MKTTHLILALSQDFYMFAWYEYHRIYGYGLGPSDDMVLMLTMGEEL